MRYRIYLRTLKFVAFYWSLPFLVGSVFTMLILTWGQVDLLEGVDDYFAKAISTVVTSCAL